MAMAMATDLQSPATSTIHPSPAPSRSRAASKARSRSRPARRRRDSSPVPSSPPGLPTPAFSPEDGHTDMDDDIVEENTLSPFDPRRITPTLHASLVSEILNLRREVDNKTKAIDTFELSLDESRTEGEILNANLSQATREARSLKHQIQLLEGGTSSAMAELARERDEAVENINDVRKKFEQVQKRARSREDDAERTQMMWDQDRENWDNERRNLERKVHVVEGRLKTVLSEVAAAQEASSTLHSQQPSEHDDTTKEKSKGSDTASVASSSQGRRRASMTSVTTDEGDDQPNFHNVRYSVMSMVAGKGDSGLNLAQELDFDEEEEFVISDEEGPSSPGALPEERPLSVHSAASYAVSSKARKILGLSMQSTSTAAGDYRALDLASPSKTPELPAVEYCDMGIQYSPPPSPKIPAMAEPKDVPAFVDTAVSTEPYHDIPEMKDTATITVAAEMTSTSCQTVEDLPSVTELAVGQTAKSKAVEMASASTQTEDISNEEPTPAQRATLSPHDIPSEIDVPMITIHPPGSEPPSPRNSVVLPPQTKNASCQASFRSVIEGRSIAIQTEEIRIDNRPVKLPASLLPSAIPDLPTRAETQDAGVQQYQPYRPPVPPPRSAKRPMTGDRPAKPPRAPASELSQAYPGNNDNGPLSDDPMSGLRRPFRSSSLFAGFEQLSDDEGGATERDIFTDDDLLNRPFASYKLRRGKMVNSKQRTSLDDIGLPEIDEHLSDPESRQSIDTERASTRGGRGAYASSSRQPGMRKMAMISSGTAAHQKTRARSPSEPSLSGSAGSSIAPPFPVPIRLSSRKLPLTGSDGPPSPTRSAGRQFSDRGARTSLHRRPTLRRVRSAAAMSQSDLAERPETLPSPTRSTSPFTADSPTAYAAYRPPPMPFDDITAPRERRVAQNPQKRTSHHRAAVPSMNWNHEREDSTGGVQPTSVVDAIAQTMVGEWMFKYVRRRKSFGMGETKEPWEGKNPDEVSANITNSGVRHKRWVWLAPYEGSIMWSSKQPTSGPALLGKSGRKFTIQSVLDVKDDNPMPTGKSSTTAAPFNRSILVLTPQRALKFTALTVERHYVWLTALSFLSHSSMGLHDLAAVPPAPTGEMPGSPTPATASLRRNPIRDSIRVAKGRPRPIPKGKRSFGNAPDPVPEVPTADDDLAADPPHVPRFSNHNRKRSNTSTAPRPPPALHAIRSFSSTGTMATMPSSHSGSSDPYFSPNPIPPPALPPGIGSGRSSISRTSEASGRASSTGASNMFDVGTVRMEAFIDHHAEQINRPRGVPSVSAPSAASTRGRKTSSQFSHGRYEFDAPSVDGGSELSFRSDPFRGF
ncbi:hypothetical protein N7509_009767 [Penicillium cosmopolitanum]|uniref:Pleckstrin homology domain-containing protein n=1 Tax=Penicillium cosmopolitanum TaxID=1131564 RepID=A0A9W9VQ10_9EURO|nr:uncharacterized protein N7509_009767 [Penicillium cosmopolitanum]KAJ5387226.1 hypothetical protein N7509_009767 [Penicillium cosmopolitanum]